MAAKRKTTKKTAGKPAKKATKKTAKKPAKKGGKAAGGNEQVGYHKGCLTTLAKERQELVRIVSIVEQLIQYHMASLRDLGVDLEKEAKEVAAAMGVTGGGKGGKRPGKKPPIDEIL